MATTLIGERKWSGSRDSEGYRTYKLTLRVVSDTGLDGPANVMQTAGLPEYGAYWLLADDIDLWAWCRWDAEIVPVLDNENNYQWDCTYTFTTKPPETKNCKTSQQEDPLLEPQKISGSFVKFQEEATTDRFGRRLTNSAHEEIRGPKVEFDKNRPQVKIEQNVPQLQLELFGPMIDTLNDDTLWGLPRRCIKLSNVSWERKFIGLCEVYYTRTMEFDVLLKDDGTGGWDRDIADEGTKVLNGDWDKVTGKWKLKKINGQLPNPKDPRHFNRFKDKHGENARTLLKGGLPAGAALTSETPIIIVESFDIVTSPVFLIPTRQPPTPDKLKIIVVDGGGDLEEDDTYLHISGFDDKGVAKTEDVSIDSGGTGGTIYAYSDTIFSSVTVIGVQRLPASIDGPLSIEIQVDATQVNAGSIYVEKYGESNFLLLGIPLVF